MSAAGRRALGAAPVLREAALALHRARALPRDVHAGPVPAGATAPGRARPRRAPGDARIPERGGRAELPARRGDPHRPPRLPGADPPGRRPSRPRLGGDGEARPVGRHAGDLHRRPWRLPGRPLARREGAVPRLHPEGALHPLRPVARGRRARAARRMRGWSRRSTWCPPSSRRSGCDPAPHLLEGRSLLPRHAWDGRRAWREAAFSELDWTFSGARRRLGLPTGHHHAWMVRTDRWKYVEWTGGFRPQLFDLAADPQDFHDLGADPAHEAVRRGDAREAAGLVRGAEAAHHPHLGRRRSSGPTATRRRGCSWASGEGHCAPRTMLQWRAPDGWVPPGDFATGLPTSRQVPSPRVAPRALGRTPATRVTPRYDPVVAIQCWPFAAGFSKCGRSTSRFMAAGAADRRRC